MQSQHRSIVLSTPVAMSVDDDLWSFSTKKEHPADTRLHELNGDADVIVRVAVRLRPFSKAEVKSNARRVLSFQENKVIVVNPNAYDADPDAIAEAAAIANFREWAQVYKFHDCLWSFSNNPKSKNEFANQEHVYRTIGSEIVNNALNGKSSTCFAYGATDTGQENVIIQEHSHL